MYKILNDSIKLGLKPATDPNDFQLLDTWGGGDGLSWVVGGVEAQMINSWIRKPQFFKGTTGFNESFGTNWDNSQWTLRDQAYYDARNAGWPNDILFVANDLGSHFVNDPTVYRSTLTSIYYKLSPGFTMSESIQGVITGTTLSEFMANIIKIDMDQVIVVKSELR